MKGGTEVGMEPEVLAVCVNAALLGRAGVISEFVLRLVVVMMLLGSAVVVTGGTILVAAVWSAMLQEVELTVEPSSQIAGGACIMGWATSGNGSMILLVTLTVGGISPDIDDKVDV